MNNIFYEMIFRRKSFHIFRNVGNASISKDELNDIQSAYSEFTPLNPGIKTAIRIVPEKQTNCKRGGEYCILLYSEKKDGYLQNIGYLGEQLDKSKRKSAEEIWEGEQIPGVSDIVRFAPSACNSQPWLVKNNGELSVYRHRKPGKRGIMPADKVLFYNRIDIGIFICFMDICLEHRNIAFEKKLYPDDGEDKEFVLNAVYRFD